MQEEEKKNKKENKKEKQRKRKRTKKAVPEKIWGCSSAGRAPALQAGGHRFDPDYLHHGMKGLGKKLTSSTDLRTRGTKSTKTAT